MAHPSSMQAMQSQSPLPPLIPQPLLQFLNSMPVCFDLVEWITQFRDALRRFLGHVDRVSVNVNSSYNPSQASHPVKLRISQGYIGPDSQKKLQVSVSSASESVLENLKLWGFPFADYQQPQIFDYYNGPHYLGTILLFRYRGASPIPIRTIEMMETLRPFIIFALTSAVARNTYSQPAPTTFSHLLAELVDDLGLTELDKEILTLRLLGYQNIDISRQLHRSPHTVTKHVQKILRKGKARHPVELFTRRYVPDLETLFFPDTATGTKEPKERDKGGRKKKPVTLPQLPEPEIGIEEKKPWIVW